MVRVSSFVTSSPIWKGGASVSGGLTYNRSEVVVGVYIRVLAEVSLVQEMASPQRGGVDSRIKLQVQILGTICLFWVPVLVFIDLIC